MGTGVYLHVREVFAGGDLATRARQRRGITDAPRARVVRVWRFNHLIHHRAQLCLYLRLLNIPVPAVYFNSADEPAWVFE